MRKTILPQILILLFLAGNLFNAAAQNAADLQKWNAGKPFTGLKKGSRLVYTQYDGKGKVQGYNRQTIDEITHGANRVEATVTTEFTDRKGKTLNSGTAVLSFRNGNFQVDLIDLIADQRLQNFDIEADVSGREMLIPERLAPGQILPEASATFDMKMKTGQSAITLPSLTFRVFDRRFENAETVETPAGKYLCAKIVQTVEAEYPLIGKQAFTSTSWTSKEIGTIKSEGYNSKGNLVSTVLLTEFIE